MRRQKQPGHGVKVGTEFRVNTTTSAEQSDPQVTGLENGGWVILWTDQYRAAPNTYDVFMQQYDSGGRQVDGQTLVNTYTPSVQWQPSVASMPDGGFVVAYASYVYSSDQDGNGLPDGGNNTYEIRLQRYSNSAPSLTDVTVNGLEDQLITLTDELFLSGFFDPEGQNLTAIKVVTLPAEDAQPEALLAGALHRVHSVHSHLDRERLVLDNMASSPPVTAQLTPIPSIVS